MRNIQDRKNDYTDFFTGINKEFNKRKKIITQLKGIQVKILREKIGIRFQNLIVTE